MSKLLEKINKTERESFLIQDIGSVITGKTPSKKHPEDWGDYVDFVTPTDFVSDSKYIYEVKRKISDQGYQRFKNMALPEKSVMVTCIGSAMGKVAITKNKSLTNQQINSIIVNDRFDVDFVYYLLTSMYPVLRSIAEEGGSTMPIITKTVFEGIEINAPDLQTQKLIAGILSSFDLKIQNNQLLYTKLEEVAETIFHHWFVNMDLQNQNGEWELRKLIEVAELNKGVSYKSSEIKEGNGGVALINLGNFKRGGGFNSSGTKYYSGDYKESHVVKPGQIIIAMTDLTSNREVIGHPARVPNNFEEAVISLDVCSIEPKKEIYTEFLYYLMLRRDFSKLMARSASGTNVSHLKKSYVEEYEFLLPDEKTLEKFNKKVKPIFAKQALLEEENQKLSEMRDLLLNKLI